MKKYILFFGFCICCGWWGCEENDRDLFEQAATPVNIWFGDQRDYYAVDSVVYNYAYRPLGCERDSVVFYVRLAGVPAEVDRTFELYPIAGDTDRIIQGKHYELPPFVIKAGNVKESFPIYLKETTDFKDQVKNIVLAVREKDGWLQGAKEYAQLRLIIKDRMEKPAFWDEDPQTYCPLKMFFGTYSNTKFRFMISVTGKSIFRVIYNGTPASPNEISYFEAQYLQKKLRAAVEEYNANPENPDRPLSDENGPITF